MKQDNDCVILFFMSRTNTSSCSKSCAMPATAKKVPKATVPQPGRQCLANEHGKETYVWFLQVMFQFMLASRNNAGISCS